MPHNFHDWSDLVLHSLTAIVNLSGLRGASRRLGVLAGAVRWRNLASQNKRKNCVPTGQGNWIAVYFPQSLIHPALFADIYMSVSCLLYTSGAPKRVEDLGLELVIMAPEMLTPLAVPEQAYPQGTLYVVVSHWATDGEFGSYEAPFTNLMDAQRQFHDDLKNELESGCIEKWREKSQFAKEETAESYECYLDGEYCENHFYRCV